MSWQHWEGRKNNQKTGEAEKVGDKCCVPADKKGRGRRSITTAAQQPHPAASIERSVLSKQNAPASPDAASAHAPAPEYAAPASATTMPWITKRDVDLPFAKRNCSYSVRIYSYIHLLGCRQMLPFSGMRMWVLCPGILAAWVAWVSWPPRKLVAPISPLQLFSSPAVWSSGSPQPQPLNAAKAMRKNIKRFLSACILKRIQKGYSETETAAGPVMLIWPLPEKSVPNGTSWPI